MPVLHELTTLGQAVWLDFISRPLIKSGELQALIDEGVRGVTSNPTILDKALSSTTDYDEQIEWLAAEGKSVREIYEAVAMTDIGQAADLFRPLYDSSQGLDGFVSLEVGPDLAYDAAATINEARHLFSSLARPNILIKVPATKEGLPAIRKLLGEGLNINVTLMFSLDQYKAVAEAYISGLEDRAAAGKDIARVASVASFFVSRVDTLVDAQLEKLGERELQGQAAIANAKLAYAFFRETFQGPRWEKLAKLGARVQRPLWASTSAKDPRYPTTHYVDTLIGSNTVNTMPLNTIRAFQEQGHPALTVETNLDEAKSHFARLAKLGIDMDAITRKLLEDGVKLFADSFNALLAGIEQKREKALSGVR